MRTLVMLATLALTIYGCSKPPTETKVTAAAVPKKKLFLDVH
jgi:hypothetical protein